ncbi:MAG: putative stress-responsive transcriptional regulator [Bacteroidetes bacterium]|nr:MAG: putative stress-responsive transcriptional regulator [Bacteroidota bacterium]
MAETRLHRSVNGRVIGGVAGGLADFFGMDPTIVRLIFVLLAVFGGGGVLLYIILWIVLPERNAFNTYNNHTPPPPFTGPHTEGGDSGIGETYEGFGKQNPGFTSGPDIATRRKFEGSLIGGVVLILIGSFFLAERFIPQIRFGDFWPLLLVVVGLVLIFNSLPGRKKDITENEES